MKDYRYIFRYCIDPGYHEEDRLEELLHFCGEAKIDEVMLFFNAEELNSGHITEAEIAPWLVMAKKMKTRLAGQGVDLSVNPWTTLIHSARGRTLKAGQDFTLMVGESGKDNGVTACPLCPEWRKYLRSLWTLVARELQPSAIWIEDDWRYHNHGRVLGFGGCFCKLHLEAFGRVIGREVTRQEVLDKVFGEGEPHPWRAVWLELNGRSIESPVVELREAVKAVSPLTRFALMCGGIDVAGAEGRRWHELQDAVGREPASMVRPTLSPYTEVWSMRKYPEEARMIVASLKRPLEIYPEYESGPRHGAYSKGCSCAAWELLGTACFGAQGITINHYDMMGCGIGTDVNFSKMLGKVKPRLNALKALEMDDDQSMGAVIPIRPDAAAYMHSRNAGSAKGLVNGSSQWGNVAAILGFSHRFTDRIERSAQPYLVSAQTVRAFSREELMTLLGNTVFFDAEAASAMVSLGFGQYLGIGSAREWQSEILPYAYEEIQESDPTLYGLSFPRLTAQRAALRLSEFHPVQGASVPSWICRYDGEKLFPGVTVFKNEMGGTAVTLAYTLGDRNGEDWFYMGYFNPYRRIFMQNLLRKYAPGMRGAFVERMPFQCYRVKTGDGEFLAALNSTTDPVESMTMRLTPAEDSVFEVLGLDGVWRSGNLTVRKEADSLLLTYPGIVEIHEGVFIRMRPAAKSASD